MITFFKLNLAAYKCAIFKIKLPYYLSFVNGCKMKTLCQKMLKFLQISIRLAKQQILKHLSKFAGG